MRPTQSGRFLLTIAILLCGLYAVPSSAELYEWTDDEGRVHLTNQPRPGANPVGLAPIGLEPEGDEDDPNTDTRRRERLDRQKAERWVDGQDEFPSQSGDPPPNLPSTEETRVPAAPADRGQTSRERDCQNEHGLSCLQLEAWMQVNGYDCEEGPSGGACRAAAKVEIEKQTRQKARERLAREDAARLAR